ncbi:MAG: inorganic pyrophosphatase/exopolyphosphatase [Bacillariaceae sp.]|jgi:inorganic pyrophosphatase/exopolyphosphatase
MSEQVGKGTPRDSVALQQLLDDTDWTQIKLPDEILGNNSITRPDPTKFFNHLQDLKFSSEFWSGLTSSQAIRMDYKSFSTFGLSSILLDMTDFFNNNKESVLPSVAKVIRENQLELFGMMFCTDDGDNKFKRELALFSTNKVTMDRLMKHLTGDNTTPNLEIEVLHEEEAKTTTETLYIVRMKQGNITASRKQVAPILLEFFQNE